MGKISKFQSVFKKLDKPLDENELIIAEFSKSDEENSSYTTNTYYSANRLLNSPFNATNSSKKFTNSKMKSKRFNPLQCLNAGHKSHNSQTSFQARNCKSTKTEANNNDFVEETFSSQDTEIAWESSGESEMKTTIYKELNTTTSSASTAKLSGNECSKYKKNLFRRCRKGGYLQQFKQTNEKSMTDRKFLKYDQKFGIRLCQTLLILKIEQSFGVYIATCCIQDSAYEIESILDRNMGKHVRVGDRLEAFFEESEEVYETESTRLPIILQPRRILMQS